MAPPKIELLVGYEELSKVTGMTHEALRQAHSRRKFSFGSFESLLKFVAAYGKPGIRRGMIDAMMNLQPSKARPGKKK